jgi:mRNA interferase MazF
MKRGEVWWVDFGPSVGGETQKSRPAIIISNDIANRTLNRVQMIPLTTSIEKCYPCEAYVHVNDKINKAMADQITTVSKKRLQNKVGVISRQDITGVERIIKIQLAL